MNTEEKLIQVLGENLVIKKQLEGLEKVVDGHKVSLYGVKGNNGLTGDMIRLEERFKSFVSRAKWISGITAGAGTLGGAVKYLEIFK